MIESIDFKLIGTSDKRVITNLNGKNLIITGENGCGKTRFLRQLHQYLQQFFKRQIQSKESIQQQLNYHQTQLENTSVSHQTYNYFVEHVQSYTKQLERISNESMDISDSDALFELVNNNQVILRFFEANRLANNIAGNGQIESISNVKQAGKSQNFEQDSSNQFEKYLVSYYNYGSHVIARENNPEKEQQINAWFEKVQNDLRDLFEDHGLILQYNPEEQAFYIHQEGKDPYRFNNLSSGYSSILSIYADLLMKVELRDIPAEDITGFVLIDEIDAHLHVSIQRKIFSFFDKAFPKIQFIVTTHSPFVVQSVNDSIIYDLSKLEPLEDLSMYSYESILKGLLGVESTSDILNKRLDEMAEIINQEPVNTEKLQELIDSIEPYEGQLNARSRAFLLLGKNALLDSTDGEG
ncbi:ATP-binding protein [Vibrio parahaemolyticus]|nr:ATP-binding protein [Vibrio parahaemolyticus]EJD3751655.1 ATP-binding protein [Vibrio parahaemolyticus]EJG0000605.1 ATP-binding protein [Vibrio parahaemolyticus]EJG0209652.1 ATP-binding protein [Vibrio parahaemolyticus]